MLRKLFLCEQSLLERRINSPDSNQIYEDRFRLLAFNLCGWEMKDNNLTRPVLCQVT